MGISTQPDLIFEFKGFQLPYCTNTYNNSFKNERAIEIPIAQHFIQMVAANFKATHLSGSLSVLEVGNVLSHYQNINHIIVDQYEQKTDIINQDIEFYNPPASFDLILSISTLEHLGFYPNQHFKYGNEEIDLGKTHRVINNLLQLLKPQSIIVATFPIGFRPDLDQTILNNSWNQTPSCFTLFKRLSDLPTRYANKWTQVGSKEVANLPYVWNHSFAQAIAVIEWQTP